MRLTLQIHITDWVSDRLCLRGHLTGGWHTVDNIFTRPNIFCNVLFKSNVQLLIQHHLICAEHAKYQCSSNLTPPLKLGGISPIQGFSVTFEYTQVKLCDES